MRAIFLCVGLIFSYAIVARRNRPETAVSRVTLNLLVCSTALIVSLIVVGYFFLNLHLVSFKIGRFLDDVPLDAAAVGMLVGYVLGDQQRGAEAAAKVGVAEAPPPELDLDHPRGWIQGLVNAARANAGNMALAVLVLVGLVAPQDWNAAFARITDVKAGAGGIGVTFGSAAGERTAEAIRAATVFPDPTGQNLDLDRNGFVPHRLGRMQALTHPPKDDGATLERNPTHFLFAKINESLTPLPSGDSLRSHNIYQIQRGRAATLHLLLGEAASDTRKLNSAARPARRSGEPPPQQALERLLAMHAPAVAGFGEAQERILSTIAPVVACLRDFVTLTGDRALLELRSTRATEYLVQFVRVWSKAEWRMADQRIEAPATHVAPDMQELRELFERFYVAHTGVADWALRFGERWQPTDGTSSNLKNCRDVIETDAASLRLPSQLEVRTKKVKAAAEADAQKISKQAIKLELLVRTGFSPYLTLLAAQALASLGDHAAAVRLLVDWLNELEKLRDKLEKPIDKAPRTAAASPLRHNVNYRPDPKRALAKEEREALRIYWLWQRLYVLSEILIIQDNSTGSDNVIPVSATGLEELTSVRFPQVFAIIDQLTHLPEWQTGSGLRSVLPSSADGCLRPTYRWRQTLILSYASWISSSLTSRHKQYFKPEDASDADQKNAQLLLDLNLECFVDVIPDPNDRRDQRAEFVVAAAAVNLNRIAGNALPAADRAELHLKTTAALETAVKDLKMLPKPGTRALQTELEKHIYGRREHPRLAPAEGLLKRLAQMRTRS